MSTPATRSEEIRAGGASSGKPAAPSSTSADDWMGAASFVFAGVAAIGMLVVMFGVFLTANDTAVLAGAIIVSLAGLGWLVVGLMMIFSIGKRWFTFSRKASKAPPPPTPR